MDTLTLTDVMTGQKNTLVDILTFTDGITPTLVSGLTLSDTLTFSEMIVHTIYAPMDDDTLTLTDSVTGISEKIGNFADTVALTDTLLQQMVRGVLFGDLLEFTEQMKRNFTLLRTFNETLTFADTLNGVAARVLGDSVSFSDAISGFISKLMKDTIDFGDSISANHITNKSMTDQLILFDALTIKLYSNLSFSDTVVLSDLIRGYATRPVFDTMGFTDTMSGVASTPLFDTMTFTESLTFTRVVNKTLSDNIIFSDDTSMAKIITLALNDALDFIEIWQAIRVKFGVMSDTLSLTDEQLRAVIPRTIMDTLTLTDSITHVKVGQRTVSDTLSLSDSLNVQTVLNRQTSDSVLFLDSFVVKIVRATTSPLIPSPPPIHEVTAPPGSVYFPNPIYEAVIDVQPQLIMTGRTRSIVLPPPEFNDFEAGQGKIVVQRSMTGRFRVYAKRTQREKLNWRFILPKYKADELRQFMLDEIDTVLNVVTWEGDYWNLQILSDTADFTETGRWAPGGNKTEVTIELVGNRYA